VVPGSVPDGELESVGLSRRGDGCWTGSPEVLEPVCSLLDRCGVLWGVYDQDAPRTFAERLFAECPDALAGRLYESVRAVLAAGSADLHIAALDAAWAGATSR